MSHTPPPYEIGKNGSIVTQAPDAQVDMTRDGIDVEDTLEFYGGHVICETITSRNAEFIVRACNAHDELVAAAEAAMDALNELIGVDYDLSGEQALLKAALGKAKGYDNDR